MVLVLAARGVITLIHWNDGDNDDRDEGIYRERNAPFCNKHFG